MIELRWHPCLIWMANYAIHTKITRNVICIRGRVEIRLMTPDTSIWRIIEIAVDMAFRAIVRDGHVRTRDRPDGGMIKRRRHPRLIAMALNTIRRELRRYVVRIRSRVEIRLVTADASVRSIIEIAVDMAFRAIVCDGYVCARNRPNGGMVKGRRHPRLITMALNTIRRELRRNVIWIRGRVETRLMTPDTSIWRIIEIAVDMAFRAIVRDGHVRARDGPNGGMVKGRRHPRLITMALNTIRWELRRNVIRICSSIEIRLVTADASIWSIIEIPVDMAFRAIVGDGHVRARDRPNGGMIKWRRRPCLICMALNTIRRELRCNVVRIRGRVEIRLMAADASIWRIIEVAVDMALRAIVRDWYVRSGDGPNGGMVKGRRRPRLIAMALNTIRRELRR
jgi:CO dehydrogenase/acetyl-CoA synthase epsilon subunit